MLLILLILTIVVVIVAIIVTIFVPGDNANFKKCKFCSKRIKIETVKCKYCKKLLIEYPDEV